MKDTNSTGGGDALNLVKEFRRTLMANNPDATDDEPVPFSIAGS